MVSDSTVRAFAIVGIVSIAITFLFTQSGTHKHSFWNVEQNPHYHVTSDGMDATGTDIRKYYRDGSVNPRFLPGRLYRDLGGFF